MSYEVDGKITREEKFRGKREGGEEGTRVWQGEDNGEDEANATS